MSGTNFSYHIYAVNLKSDASSITRDDILVDQFLTPERVAWCEKSLSKFDFVKWDRFIRAIGTSPNSAGPVHAIICYGWIDREQDSYKDMVVISLLLDEQRVNYIASSSDKYSERICACCGSSPSLHKKCVRIENRFNIPNSIHLKKKTESSGTEQKTSLDSKTAVVPSIIQALFVASSFSEVFLN